MNDSNHKNRLKYHDPAAQWEIFGSPDFETFCEKKVAKGLFHSLVHKDVLGAYEVAEHIMAHAYYHYPAYDEAYTKLLRIMEMAVKIRCKDLGIELTATQKRNGKPYVAKKNYNSLINELSDKEPVRNLKNDLHGLRELRNARMHSDSFDFSSLCYHPMKFGVCVLNKLFLPESVFIASQQQVILANDHIKEFKNGLMVLQTAELRTLTDLVNIEDALFIDGEWYYFLTASPIINNIEDAIKKFRDPDRHTFQVKNISIEPDGLLMTDIITQSEVSIKTTSHPDNISYYQKFLAEQSTALAKYRSHSFISLGHPTALPHYDFMYRWLWKTA